MKTIIFALMFSSLTGFAQSPEEAARRLDTLQNPAPEVTCDNHLMTPDEAVRELNSSSKTFLGRKQLAVDEQNYSCIYKTDKAYVIYHHCMASRRENQALEFDVLSFEGNIFKFTMENNGGLPSALKRSDYNMNWGFDVKPTNPPGRNLNADQLNRFMATEEEAYRGSCFMGGTMKAKQAGLKASCSSMIKNADTDQWKAKAETFWQEPGEEWYRAIKESRRRMTSF